jgi:tetratricopeptide (TPR) repeat protein
VKQATITFRIALMCAAAGLALGATGARADLLSQCKDSKDGKIRLYSCGELLKKNNLTAPVRADVYRARGDAYADRAHHQEAIADYSEAIKLRSDDWESYYGRGQARLAVKDLDGAIADLSQAIRYKSDAPGLFVARGYAQLIKGNAGEAIADFTIAIRLDPKNASALNNRGLAYRKGGQLDAAIEDYTAAIGLNPVYALAYNNRGYVYEAKGNKQAAASDFRRALALDPTLVGARSGLKRLGEPETVAAETDQLIAQGRELAQRNCAWCHAIGKTGESANPRAPAWRDLNKRHPVQALRTPLTRGIARPHDEMPKFKLSDDETDKIVAYINSLNP